MPVPTWMRLPEMFVDGGDAGIAGDGEAAQHRGRAGGGVEVADVEPAHVEGLGRDVVAKVVGAAAAGATGHCVPGGAIAIDRNGIVAGPGYVARLSGRARAGRISGDAMSAANATSARNEETTDSRMPEDCRNNQYTPTP